MTVSAKKRHDEAKAAAELKRKQREDEKEAKRLQKLEEKVSYQGCKFTLAAFYCYFERQLYL